MLKRGVFVFLFSCLLLYSPRPLPALQEDIDSGEFTESDEIVELIQGDAKIFPTNTPTRVMVNNPNIADVVDATNEEITVNAKSAGTTTLSYVDLMGEHIIKLRVIPEDIHELKYRVDKILETLGLSEIYTQPLPEEGKVAILGKINKADDRKRMDTALGDLKVKTIDLTLDKEQETVIEIDVQVLEIDKGATRSLGFTWPSGVTINEVSSPGIATHGATNVTTTGGLISTATTVTEAGTGWGTLFRVFKLSRNAFQLSIDALAQDGKARILSRPRLACQSGKEAELFVGGEKPVFTTNIVSLTGTQAATVDYKEYGIKLNIKPTIVEEGRLKLVLKMDVSELGDAESIGTASTGAITAKAYPVTKRSAATELFMNDGQTLAIGGLIRQKTEESHSKVPGLGDIPILGAIFRKKALQEGGGAAERGNTELFILLTPTVIANKEVTSSSFANVQLDSDDKLTEALPAALKQELMMNIVEYSKQVQKRILETLVYPESAREAGFQGTVKLGLHISYSGNLLEAEVKQSSGYKILDDNAIKTAKAIGTYPPFPSSIEQEEIWIDVPIIYKVD